MGNVQVFVQDQDDKMISFSFSNTEELQKTTVLQLKERISKEEHIPVDQQQLIFQGQQMKDSKLLSEYDVQHKSTIHLSRRLCGRGAEGEEEEQKMVNIQVSIMRPLYKKCKIDLTRREMQKMTVLQLKQMICKKEGVPVDKQRLMFDECPMKDSALLSEWRVRPESPCVQEEQEQKMENITVFVQNLTDEKTEYNLGNTEEMQKMTVLQLKELIYEKEGIPVDKQRLIFNSWPMKNSALLSKYKVHHGSTIYQAGRPCVQGAEEQEQKMENIKIFVKTMTERTIEFNLGNTEKMQKTTVLQLKELIYNKEGIPEDQQRLIFKCWQLRDSQLLYEYGVQHETVVRLSLRLRGGSEFRGSIEMLVDFLELQEESELSD